MKSKSKNKNDIFYFILLILTLITMCVGITFTYFSLVASEEDDSTQIRTGTLSINYIDGRKIDTYALFPTYEPNLNSTKNVYRKEFSVKSDGTLDQTLDIYINVTENKFTNNALKFAIYDSDNNRLSTGSIPSVGSVLLTSGVSLESGDTKNFTVLIWLQETNQNQDSEQARTFVGGFDITANQIKYE